MIAQISESIWMWIVGGTCCLVLLLGGVLGGFILNSILKLKDEIKDFRLEFTANKGETITWTQFASEKEKLKKEIEKDIELAFSRHADTFNHEYSTQ